MSGATPTAAAIIAAWPASGSMLAPAVGPLRERFGFAVLTHRASPDLDDHQSRELDVWGDQPVAHTEAADLQLAIELLGAGKNHDPHPLVFLGRPTNAVDEYLDKANVSFSH